MRILILFISILFTCTQAYSQATIKGSVGDSLDQRPLQFAVVSIVSNSQNKIINSVITDSLGKFEITSVPIGIYNLKINLFGYLPKVLNNLEVQQSTVQVGKISLSSDAVQTTEVVVNGQVQKNTITIEKQTYKANQFEAAKGGTAIDVLKNMPSITVNAEGEIRLRGNTGFLVLVNGKAVLTDANTVLSQLPANSIDNIEIITSPGAKYDADGKAGIINITTKKGTDDGLILTINGQYGLPSFDDYNNKKKPTRYSSDVLINYKKNKLDIAFSGSIQKNDLSGLRDGNVNTTIDNRYSAFPSVGERSFRRNNYTVRANVSYAFDKNNNLSIGLYRGQRIQYRQADIDYQNLKTDINTGQVIGRINYYNANLVKKQGDFTLVNLDYSHTFSNKANLVISGLYEGAILSGYTHNLNAKPGNPNDTSDYVNNTTNSPVDGWRGKIDYSIPLGKGKLESGYQLRYQQQTGAFLYQNAVLGTGTFVTVPEFSANIHLNNQIHGVYTQYSAKYKKLDYVAGLRYEYAERIFHAKESAPPNTLYLSNFFPSVNLLYNAVAGLKWKAGYSRRVQRSTNNELNPLPEREHSETLEQGDPNIKPEFINLSEVGLIKEFKTGTVFLNVYNQQIENVVNRVNSVYNDTILNRIYTNAGKATSWGAETGLTVKPWKWYNLYAGVNLYNYSINGSLFNSTTKVKNAGIVYNLTLNQTFNLHKTLSVQLSINYLSLRPTAQGKDSRFITPNLSVKKTFLAGKLTATAQWQYIGLGIIPSNEQRISTWGTNFYTTTNYIQEKDIVLLNLSYNFKQSTKKVKLINSEFIEREF